MSKNGKVECMNSPSTETAGDALRKLRNLAGLRIEDVAREANVSAAQLSRVENGAARPRPRWVAAVTTAIAEALQQQAAQKAA